MDMWTRRRFLIGLGSVGVGAVAIGCGSNTGQARSDSTEDFSARFSGFDAADEPDGDLSKVVWPRWIEGAKGDVKQLYEFQIVNGSLMRYMPCFCGCGQDAGHRNNRDCYIKEVNADGTVVFDAMAPS